MSIVDKDFRNVLFVSRNKDNRGLNNSIYQPFKPRVKSFVARVSPFDVSSIYDEFETFANEGVNGEVSRLYVSVNARDEQRVHRALLHELIDKPDFNMTKIDSKIASIAMKPVNRKTSHWLFDFDRRDFVLFYKFFTEVSKQTKILAQKPTMNGYALVVAHGFDTREILKKYPMATLKRDAMLLSYWKKINK
jgi:hypothetical protein